MTSRLRLLWVIPAVLVMAGCGTAAPARDPSRMSNELAAQRDAENLLHLLALPPGAQLLSSVPGHSGGLLTRPGTRPVSPNLIDRFSLWRVRSPLDSVMKFIMGHAPRGRSRQSFRGWGSGPHVPSNRWLVFLLPATQRISTRWLTVTAVALSRNVTGLRIDAQDVWTVVRSPSEEIPSGVHEIDMTSKYPGSAPSMAVSVVNLAQVSRIIRWIDALPVAQPGVISCPGLIGPAVTIDFRTATRVLLARANVLDAQGTSGPCNTIELSIRSRRVRALLAGNFLKRVERLVGVQFARHTRR